MMSTHTWVYTSKTNHAVDINKMVKMMKDTNIDLPKDHDDKVGRRLICVWEKEVDLCIKGRKMYNSNKCALYSVLWG